MLGALAVCLGVLLVAPATGLANPITDENAVSNPLGDGTPWERSQADSPNIEGYTNQTSYAPGETIRFHVSTNPVANYRIIIYRLGWYGGAGARRMTCLPSCSTSFTGVAKSVPAPNGQTGLIDAGWTQSTSLTIPTTSTLPGKWTTGEYVAEYLLTSGSQAGFVRYSQFVVRSNAPPASASNILVVVPFNNYLAYNTWGGTSAYENTTSQAGPFPPSAHDHAYKVSYNRPFHRREWRFWDLPLLRFLEREGYDVSYVSDTDVDANPNLLLQHRAVIVSGHSEYWTKVMRNGFDAARDQGTNLLFAGANDAYWQIRYEDSSCPDDHTVCSTVGDRRTMVIYKGPNEGPEDPAPGTADDTSKFRELGRPECELQGGVQFGSWFPNDGYRDYTTTADGASDPWAAGTGLSAGSTITGLVGFEYDSYFPACQPPGTPKILFTYQGPETTAQHDSAAVKYIANGSGARVFSSGTEQWSWGLDSYRWDPNLFTGIPPTNPAIQQYTRNMLADMADPAAPTGLSAVKSGNTVQLDTTPRTDPRVTSYRVYRHAGTGAFQPGDPGVTLVCQNASGDCTDSPPNGTYRYASVAVDQWNDSAVAMSSAVTVTTPVTAVNDSATVSEDAAATAINVLTNDTPSAETKTITAVTQPTNGQVVITGGGSGLTYRPNLNYCNNPPGTSPDTFTYTINAESTATVSVTVTCVDDTPVALRDPVSVLEDDPATQINVLANDTDVDGGPKTVNSVTQPANGTVVRNADGGGLTYEPDDNFCNFVNGQGPIGPTDDFTYTLNGGSIGTVAMTVDCVNDAPSADDDAATVSEDAAAAAIPVLANDDDVEGDAITITSKTDPAHGAVQITGGGTGLTYQPATNYCGPDSFSYTVNGGDTANVSITVTCVNDPPVANDDTGTVAEDANATAIPVLTNDADVDGDAITITSKTNGAHGTVAITGGGTGLTYQPAANYCGPDSFSYTVNGGDTANVSITVTCVNDAPIADNDSDTVGEDSGATAINVLGNDTDQEDDPITISSSTDPANGTVVLTGGSAGAHTGLTYRPEDDYCNSSGSPDTFQYTVNGGDTATVAVTVNCVDDGPVPADDSATMNEDASATAIPVLTNDTDIDGGPKAINSAGDPANGTVAITGGGNGLTYEPDDDYCNDPGAAPSDDFTYTVNGGETATVSVTVTCVDDAPVALDDAATMDEDAAATAIPVLSNDTDVDSGPKTIDSAEDPAKGTVVITGGGNGLTYEPDDDYCNDPGAAPTDDFAYTLNGGDTATVSVTVTCVDDAPVAVDDLAAVSGNSAPTRIDVRFNDTDIDDGPKTIQARTQPANGNVVITNGGQDLTYQPNSGYCSDPPTDPTDDFTYTLNGGDTATVAVTVDCSQPPTANDDTATVAQNAAATTIPVLGNDNDPDGGLMKIQTADDPPNGTVALTGGGAGLTYQPNPGYCNSASGATDDFTYTLNGGDTATVFMTVTCAPVTPPTTTTPQQTVPAPVKCKKGFKKVKGKCRKKKRKRK